MAVMAVEVKEEMKGEKGGGSWRVLFVLINHMNNAKTSFLLHLGHFLAKAAGSTRCC